MIWTGELLAKQIDTAASKNIKNYEKNHLERIIQRKCTHWKNVTLFSIFQN